MCVTYSIYISINVYFPSVFQKSIQAYQANSVVVVTGATLDVLCVHSVMLVSLHLRRGWLVGLQGGVHLTYWLSCIKRQVVNSTYCCVCPITT